MRDFDYYLDKSGEIGFVEKVMHSIVYVSGLPQAHPFETTVFETGEVGQIISMDQDLVEILLLSPQQVKAGSKVVRTGELLQIPMTNSILGRVVDCLVNPFDGGEPLKAEKFNPVDTQPHGIIGRQKITKPLETGVALVDLAVPLAKGQRELVIGDRKTGKTEFLLQTILSQAQKGTICIYAAIGQKLIDIKKWSEFFEEKNIKANCLMVASCSSDPAGLVFLTPYTAMTIAEYFRDQDMDVLLILDDMSTHAKYYREISLLAKRFPGRSSYPGDIFYAQARLIERAGNYKRGSITCLPVSESLLGDLSGYIQTNLMAMTDGHIFFDIDIYNQGKRPAVNSSLSVTRVGHQAQTPLQRDLGRELAKFIVNYEKMKQFVHFGAEAGEIVKEVLDMGARVDAFFNQSTETIVPININVVILAGIWTGLWVEEELKDFEKEVEKLILTYQTNKKYKTTIDKLVESKTTFFDLVDTVRKESEVFLLK